MSIPIFTERQKELLRLLGEKRTGDERRLFDLALLGELPKESIGVVCGMINDEFLMQGINADYSPNAYGLELEALLDVVNRSRILSD